MVESLPSIQFLMGKTGFSQLLILISGQFMSQTMEPTGDAKYCLDHGRSLHFYMHNVHYSTIFFLTERYVLIYKY